MILFQSLRKNKTFSVLSLEDSVFFDSAFIRLEELLKATISLKTLSLKNILHLNITKFSQTQPLENLRRVLSGLSENKTITEVFIGNHPASSTCITGLDDDENLLSSSFHKLFSINSTIKTFGIENFRIGNESFKGISEGIGCNQSIKNLNLKGNLMGWADLAKFLAEIQKNTVLEAVDLTNNGLDTEFKKTGIETFQVVFEHLSRSELKSFGIDFSFWNISDYPSTIFELVNAAKSKFV